MTCETITKWGRCQQDKHGPYTYCYFHLAHSKNKNNFVDDYYHKKIALKLLSPTGKYLNFSEVDSMFSGRVRNDGRRLDKYAP